MKRILSVLLSSVLIGLSALEKDLVFRMDFDSPVTIGSESMELNLPKTGLVPGKFGNGYYFQTSAFNFLHPDAAEPCDKKWFRPADGTTLAFEKEAGEKILSVSGKAFSIAETPVSLWHRKIFFTKPMTAVTFSVWVKGPAGSKVTLKLAFVPEKVDDRRAAALFKKYAGNKLISSDTQFAAKSRPDIPGEKEFLLTGEWQRIAVYAQTDVRLVEARNIRAVGSAEIASEGEVRFRKMQMEHTMYYPYNTFQPTAFLPGKSARPLGESGVKLSLDSIQNMFPQKEGTVCFFMKTPQSSNLPASAAGFFCFGNGWRKPMWCVDNGRIVAGTKETVYLKKTGLTFPEWTHFALTWSEDEMVVYLNGKAFSSEERSYQNFSPAGYFFCVGKNLWSERSADAVMDEFLIFSRMLKTAEIKKLAEAKAPFPSKSKPDSVRILPFAVPRFFRNDPEAGVTLEVHSEKDRQVTAELVTDFHHETKSVALKKGLNSFKLAFHPELKMPGKGTWKIRLLSDDGRTLYENRGPYAVAGALRKDLVRIISWGGEGAVPFDYEKKLGISARNAMVGAAGEIIENGMMLSLDLRNHRELPKNNFDCAKTASETRGDLRDIRESFAWYATILNSESIGSWRSTVWEKYPVLMDDARKALGFDPPVTRIRCNPDMCLDRGTMAFDSQGVFEPGETWKTLFWYRTRGDKIYDLNAADAKMVKSLRPDNLTWTDPAYPGLFRPLDMGSDWAYSPALQDVAGRLRYGWSHAEVYGKLYQPTLTMYYWINNREMGTLDGKTYILPRSPDELTADCWAALGCAPMHDLCFFNTYAWYDAETDSKNYLPMKGMSEVFGRFMRNDFYPAVLLLRDMAEPPARVALFMPEDISYYSEHDWNYYRVRTQWLRSLSQNNIHFDVVTGEKFRKAGLDQYSVIIVPMRSKASKTAHAALLKAAEKAQIVVDDYCPAKYPNMVKLNYKWAGYDFKTFSVCDDFVKKLAGKGPGRSFTAVGEKGPVMTFEKNHQGVRYFIVINNHWSADGYLARCAKQKQMHGLDFKPYGIPQKVRLSFSDPAGSAVYDFLKSAELKVRTDSGKSSFDFELGPGEGKVFCVYPVKIADLKLSCSGTARRGNPIVLSAELLDRSGKRISGRQLLHLSLRDSRGSLMDESGFYTLENGIVKIPVFIAKDAVPGSWKALIAERTAGLRQVLTFEVAE